MPTMTPKELAKALLEKNKIASPNNKKQQPSVENSSTTNEEGNVVVTNSEVSNTDEQQGEDETAADDHVPKIIPPSNKDETGNTDTRAQECSPKHKHNKSSKHTKETSRYPQRNGRGHVQKIPESQTNENIAKPTRKDKDLDEQDSDKEMETVTKKLHREPPKDRATKKNKQSTSTKKDNYNDERQRETKRLEEKKRKGVARNEFGKDKSQNKKSREEKKTQHDSDNSKNKKSREDNQNQHDSEKQKAKQKAKEKNQKQQNLYYDASTSSEGDDDKHTLEENTPTRPFSNTKNLERTNSASSQRSDDFSEDQNRDVYRYCKHISGPFFCIQHVDCLFVPLLVLYLRIILAIK